jgi:hypothetical protein
VGKNRAEQLKLMRRIPQINEEYGYEDHYPGPWGGGRKAPARAADNRRRLVWEMSMAGRYQTTGQRADVPGMGGWLTGRGDDSMTLLRGDRYLAEFITSFEWWRCDPVDELGTGYVRAATDRERTRIAAYLPQGGTATLALPAGKYTARFYDPAAAPGASRLRQPAALHSPPRPVPTAPRYSNGSKPCERSPSKPAPGTNSWTSPAWCAKPVGR